MPSNAQCLCGKGLDNVFFYIADRGWVLESFLIFDLYCWLFVGGLMTV